MQFISSLCSRVLNVLPPFTAHRILQYSIDSLICKVIICASISYLNTFFWFVNLSMRGLAVLMGAISLNRHYILVYVVGSVVDPYWFQSGSGSGSSICGECWSGSRDLMTKIVLKNLVNNCNSFFIGLNEGPKSTRIHSDPDPQNWMYVGYVYLAY